MSTNDEQSGVDREGGFVFHGSVQTGSMGPGASANIGAIGEHSRGTVNVARNPASERQLAELLEAVRELREAVANYQDQLAEDGVYDSVEDGVNEVEKSIEEARPTGRILVKLKTLERLVSPWDTLLGLVTKLLELVQKSES